MYAPTFALDVDDDRRLDLRQFVDVPLTLMESDAASEQVQILNVARRGFLARAFMGYHTDERVRLHLNGGSPVDARIVWCTNGMIGARFDDRFDLTRLQTANHPECSNPTAESRSNR